MDVSKSKGEKKAGSGGEKQAEDNAGHLHRPSERWAMAMARAGVFRDQHPRGLVLWPIHRDANRSGWGELLRNTPTPRLDRPRMMFTETYRDLLETGVPPRTLHDQASS